MSERKILVEAEHVSKYFPTKDKKVTLKAVDDISLTVREGETLGLVGESGCGKSTFGRTILRLIEPTSGRIRFEGQDITRYRPGQMREMRKSMQMIFQNPYSSLNPRMTVLDAVKAPLDAFHSGTREEKLERVLEIFRTVGLDQSILYRYPHEFSGGQRQRIVIARALVSNPRFIVCDEAVSALDVSVRAQVLNLMQDIQRELGIAYLFISHDLSVVKHISDRIAVMYLGKIVEISPKEELYENPRHPYTQALLSAIPIPDLEVKKERIVLKGDVPSPLKLPGGCRFHTRCPFATERCVREEPELTGTGNDHLAACHRCQGG